MKKKIFGGIAVLAIAAVAAFNVDLGVQYESVSGVTFQNVEALAQSEYSDGCYQDKDITKPCKSTYKYSACFPCN